MKLKDSLNKRLNTRLASLVMLSVLSVPWVASAAGNSVVANNMLPGNGKQGDVIAGKIEGGFNGSWTQGNQMNLHQTTQNAIVTWDSFSIGANASVTIRGDHDNFNMLNYVTGSESSQIYGKLNSYVGDKQGGNIYLVNPNGVQIGNSAEINVGSLHIANKKIDNINTWNENTDIANALKQNKAMTNAELMSLGYINANKLVFEGERVVIDMDRLSGLDTTKADAITLVSKPYDDKSVGDNRKYDVVLGSSTPEKAKEWANIWCLLMSAIMAARWIQRQAPAGMERLMLAIRMHRIRQLPNSLPTVGLRTARNWKKSAKRKVGAWGTIMPCAIPLT